MAGQSDKNEAVLRGCMPHFATKRQGGGPCSVVSDHPSRIPRRGGWVEYVTNITLGLWEGCDTLPYNVHESNMKTLPGIDELISLGGKHALITGSAAGIGKAIAHRFAEAGASLSLVDIDEDTLAVTERELAESRAHASSHVVDLSDKNAVDRLWVNLAGREPDILVGGRRVGETPAKVEIDPGIGELTLIKEGYKPWSIACITEVEIEVSLRKSKLPVARIYAPAEGTALEELRFSAVGSTDPGGVIADYCWEFGDGATAAGEFVLHRYERPGIYRVVLTVVDDGGATGSATREVVIGSQSIDNHLHDLIQRVPFNLGLDVGRGQGGWSLGLLIGDDVRIGGSITFTGEDVPDYYEVPPQPWEGEVCNLGPELELCALLGTPFIAGVSIECGIGVSFQQRVHIATMPAPQRETQLLPQRAVILPNGYADWETYLSASLGISTHLEGAMLSLRYHYRRGWIVRSGFGF